jgi:hypothetical protein
MIIWLMFSVLSSCSSHVCVGSGGLDRMSVCVLGSILIWCRLYLVVCEVELCCLAFGDSVMYIGETIC